jgi:hypothetical protein
LVDALNEQKIAERKSFAESHTWAASVNQLYKLINKLYKNED